MKFIDLNLIEPILKAVDEEGYTEPTPIQIQVIPHLLNGRDLMGCAQTGTGKTAAFALPIIQKIAAEKPRGKDRPIRALVLAPTRELATQIHESFNAYGRHTGLHGAVIYGGVSQRRQEKELAGGVDIVIATPGRLLDLINQKLLTLKNIEYLVLDEADRMLDMGFIKDIRAIIGMVPKNRQTLLFSATLPDDIVRFAQTILRDPISVSATPEVPTVEAIEQKVYFVERENKADLLYYLVNKPENFRVLVFCETKFTVDVVEGRLNRIDAEEMKKAGKKRKYRIAEAIHSDKSQRARERAMDRFKNGEIQVLVATDIAARGIDVEDIDLVVNYDFPKEAEIYVHRIGRTGRAGASGIAISFCTILDRLVLPDIEIFQNRHLDVVDDHPYKSDTAPSKPTILDARKRAKKSASLRRRRRRR